MQHSQLTICSRLSLSPNQRIIAYLHASRLTLKHIHDQTVLASSECSLTTPAFMEFNQQGSLLLLGNKRNQIQVLDVTNASLPIVCSMEDACSISELVWLQSGQQFLIISELGLKATLVDLCSQSIMNIKNTKQVNKGYALAHGHPFLALLEKEGTKEYIRIYNTVQFKLANSLQIEGVDPAEIQWSPDDSTLVVWDGIQSSKILAFDPMFGIRATFEASPTSLSNRTVLFTGDSQFCICGTFDDRIRVLNKLLFKSIGELELSPSSFQKATHQIYLYRQEERKNEKGSGSMLVPVDNLKLVPAKVGQKTKGPLAAGVSLMEVNSDATLLASKTETYPNVVFVWNLKAMCLHTAMCLLNHVRSFAWTAPDTLAIANSTHRVVFWRPSCCFLMEVPFKSFENMADSKLSIIRLAYNQRHEMLLLRDKGSAVWIRLAGMKFEDQVR